MAPPPQRRLLSLGEISLLKNPAALIRFFAKLGYAVEAEPVPLNKHDVGFSPADAANIRTLYLLADQDQQLQVFLFELDAVAMTRLRSLATNLLNRGGNYLLVATTDYRRLTFVNPRRDGSRVRIRKLVVDTVYPTRHDLDVLEGLAVEGRGSEALFLAQCEAFDVERVTNRFYREYASLFHSVERAIAENNRGIRDFYEPEKLHEFTQRLLGRIMFLYFIQKKGWLAGDPRFLTNHFRATLAEEGNYYARVLEPLFFETLNKRREGDRSPWGSIPYLNGGLFDRAAVESPPNLIYLPNDVFDPSLDTGILGFFNNYNFTVTEDTPAEQEVAVDPEMLGKVFENMMEERERGRSGTFYTPRSIVHYMCREALLGYLEEQTGLEPDRLRDQFDEEEAEPLRVHEARRVEKALREVRVLDPAVGTGAFLLGILQEMVALKRACYRAQGAEISRSGALVAGWKREFIADALHGVDNKPEAIEIAKLRLWLSLVVDLERDQVEPLPNLGYKLRVGNSLLETLDGELILPELPNLVPTEPYQGVLGGMPDTGVQLQLGLGETSRARADLAELKARYFEAEEKAEKERLRQQIEAQERAVVLAALQEKLDDIATTIQKLVQKGSQVNWRGMAKEKREMERLAARQNALLDLVRDVKAGEPLPFFLYRLHFFEVFRDKGGFDIVIANPPYVRMELITEQKEALKAAYPDVYDGRADLYVYFYARGLDLLRPGGMLAFISSNKFMRARYGKGLRKLLGEESALHTVIDFGDLPVFEATAYPSIVITRKRSPSSNHSAKVLTVSDMETLARLEEEVPRQNWYVPQVNLRSRGWALEQPEVLQLVDKLRATGRPLRRVVDEQFYMGVKTGLNDAFIIDATTRERLIEEDPRSAEIIKPWLRGRDVKRWRVDWNGLYVIFTYHRVEISNYPAILAHLEKFRDRLEQRATSNNHEWYELQQPQMGIYPEFETRKIVYPEFAPSPAFGYDPDGRYYVANKLYIIPNADFYLLGVLNSAVTAFQLRQLCSLIRGDYIEFRAVHLGQIPVPDAPTAGRRAIEALVQRLLDLRGEGLEAASLEQELNERVYRLFGLTKEEIAIIEDHIAKE